LELNVWPGTEFESGTYDEHTASWTVVLRRSDGTKREMHPRHVVMATGLSGLPAVPKIPTLENFRGTVLHSTQFEEGAAWKGKRAIIIGTGTSAHDIQTAPMRRSCNATPPWL
jgi:putative flavoprotein involved in K+ transport